MANLYRHQSIGAVQGKLSKTSVMVRKLDSTSLDSRYKNTRLIKCLCLPAKAISHSVVTIPPSLMSWPALMRLAAMRDWVTAHMPFRAPELTSGHLSPSWAYACASKGTDENQRCQT
eukprot:scaffold124427_cov20-Tisochrysis_lutea.AAC.4